MKTPIQQPAACRAFEAGLPITIWLLLLAANGAIAAAPQIIPSMSFQQSAVNLDQTNTFTVSVSGDPPLRFQWRQDGSDLLNETNSSLVTYPAQPADEGDYSVVVTNAFGAITSNPTRLWVTPPATDFVKDNFTNTAGLRLPYFYLLPGGYDPARRYPLDYMLHGNPGDETCITNAGCGGGQGYANYAALKVVASYRQQQTDPAILVMPARRAGDAYVGWTAQYLQLLSGLLDHLLVQFSIDTNRVYVQGGSEGFHAAWDLLGMRPGFFAAGTMTAGWQGTNSAASIKDVPIWIWCARDDGSVPFRYSQQAVSSLRLAGGNPIYTEYQVGGHVGGIGMGLDDTRHCGLDACPAARPALHQPAAADHHQPDPGAAPDHRCDQPRPRRLRRCPGTERDPRYLLQPDLQPDGEHFGKQFLDSAKGPAPGWQYESHHGHRRHHQLGFRLRRGNHL